MPLTTHSGLPSSIVAGDTVQWREAEPDDESEVIRAVYHFRPDSGDGDGFKIEPGTAEAGDTGNYIYKIEESDTAEITAGLYSADLVISRDPSGRKTLANRHRVRILPNPEAGREKSHAERMIPILEKFLESDQRMLTRHNSGGVELEPMNREEARRMLRIYRNEARDEAAVRRVRSGQRSGNTIHITF